MTLDQIFDQLTYGELASLAIGGVNESKILVKDYPNVISHINLGLTELYKRFTIKTEEVIIQQYEQIETYYLDSKYAESNDESVEPIKYIMDSVFEPFTDNVLKIQEVYDEAGELLFKNDSEQHWSIYTPTYNSIQLPYPINDNNLSVIFKANHAKISPTITDPTVVELELPISHLEALLFYVASRIYSGMGTAESIQESSNYLMKFEESCKKLDSLGLTIRDETTNIKLHTRGFA